VRQLIWLGKQPHPYDLAARVAPNLRDAKAREEPLDPRFIGRFAPTVGEMYNDLALCKCDVQTGILTKFRLNELVAGWPPWRWYSYPLRYY